MLMAVRASLESGEMIAFLDVENQKAYCLDGCELDQDSTAQIISALFKQQANSAFNMPHDKIREVLRTEQKLSEENNKHIFRRV